MEKEQRVTLNADDPNVWGQYDQDTLEVRMSDSGCPGAGDGLGPAQVAFNRTQTLFAVETYLPAVLNPSDGEEIWE